MDRGRRACGRRWNGTWLKEMLGQFDRCNQTNVVVAQTSEDASQPLRCRASSKALSSVLLSVGCQLPHRGCRLSIYKRWGGFKVVSSTANLFFFLFAATGCHVSPVNFTHNHSSTLYYFAPIPLAPVHEHSLILE